MIILITQPEQQHLIITKGSSGSEYCKLMYPAEKVNVFDVVGAGDTFYRSTYICISIV